MGIIKKCLPISEKIGDRCIDPFMVNSKNGSFAEVFILIPQYLVCAYHQIITCLLAKQICVTFE